MLGFYNILGISQELPLLPAFLSLSLPSLLVKRNNSSHVNPIDPKKLDGVGPVNSVVCSVKYIVFSV